MTNASEKQSVRIDKWLWAARMFKTRSMAANACNAGHAKLAGSSAKPAKMVRRGDRIEVVTPGGPRVLEIVELGERRGPASEARSLYIDHTPAPPENARGPADGARARGLGRPSKRDRRVLERLRGTPASTLGLEEPDAPEADYVDEPDE